jgi:hypothetical protein
MGWILAALLLFGFASLATAQTLGEVNTAMNMSNTLNGGASAGYVPGMDPRNMRSSYIAPRAPVYTPPMPTAMLAPAAPAPAPMPMTPPPPPVKKILVLTGERVTCAVMGTLLEDIHYEYRPESEKGEYYDDGTHGDLRANDNIYTNYTERPKEVISAEANRIKLLYLRMLELGEQTNPLEFFRIPVATEEPLSTLPRLSDEEKDRDETFLRQWHQQFLASYRRDDQDPMSDFYPIFVPNPPRAPETPAPPNDQYNANAFFLDAAIQQIVNNATAPAIEQPDQQLDTGGRGTTARPRRSSSSGEGGGSAGYTGDRWGQLRSDAKTYGATYGAGSSRYFR